MVSFAFTPQLKFSAGDVEKRAAQFTAVFLRKIRRTGAEIVPIMWVWLKIRQLGLRGF